MTKTAKAIVTMVKAINNAKTQEEREILTEQLERLKNAFENGIDTDTNTETVKQASEQQTQTTKAINTEPTTEQIEEETAKTTNFEPIKDFKADLKGAERLVIKGVKLINRFGNIFLNQWDKQDAISAVYIAVLENEPKEGDTALAEISQQYFGLKTREQFRAGYNALQRVVYGNMRSAKSADYDQEYGLDGTATKDEHAEVELDILLQEILSEKLNRYLDYYLQGYKQKEIAEILGVSINIPKKYLEQCKTIIGAALNYKG